MILHVGKIYKSRFSLFKKTYIFECGDHAMVLEREKGQVTLYATNAACSEIYCEVPLGKPAIWSKQFIAISYSQDKMLIDGQGLLIVVDFLARKVAVNQPHIKAIGKAAWGDDVQLPWEGAFNGMFGLEGGSVEMDVEAAGDFWSWFGDNQEQILEQIAEGGSAAAEMNVQISKYLGRVFPYEKETDIEFQVGSSQGSNALFVYHFNRMQLKADTEKLGTMMPVALRDTWKYITEA